MTLSDAVRLFKRYTNLGIEIVGGNINKKKTDMEITGKIIEALPQRGGVSARTGNSWKMQDFVIETQEQYPKKCCFCVFGEDKLKEFNLQVGDVVTIYLDFDAREYSGRWYNDFRAWKVKRE